ncbi:MAG: pseudouridine synthase [Lachnospiraceae bacterium]
MEQRINKFLSSAGICSRREADRLIEAGRVIIDNEPAVCGSKVCDGQKVFVDGKLITGDNNKVFIAFNKPKGVVCTTGDGQGGISITDYINYPVRIYPVGRLDKESTGLIFLTNEGELSDKILRSRNCHEKEYEVTVERAVTEEFISRMAKGVYLEELDRTTKPCVVERTGFKTFRIILTQGLNRQIRRMCATLGYNVVELKRIRIMNVVLGDLQEGKYRELTGEEYDRLVSQL